ncbi:MAG: hypothetical protein KAR19_03775 [Bacteroidales bacterium]|nr:hypothetical protein [Bacteroidales bacterium]
MKRRDSLNVGAPAIKPGTLILDAPPGGIPGYIKSALVYLTALQIGSAKYPNKIGDQDRVAAGGQNFTGRAYAFDGVDQCAYVADNGALDINQATTDFCLCGPIEITDLSEVGYVFGKNVGGAKDGRYGLHQNGGSLTCYVESSGGLISIADNITLTEQRYSIVIHVDRSAKKVYFYIDSVLQNAGGTSYTGTIGTLANAYEFYLGAANSADGSGLSSHWKGRINDVRIFHKNVTSASDLASLQKGERLGDEVAWWFCEGEDTLEVHDASGNGYHLTAQNFDSTSFVEGPWQSLMNKFGYAKDVTDGNDLNVSNCVNLSFDSFSNASPSGFEASDTGGGSALAGTADEISYINTRKYKTDFFIALNSGTLPKYAARTALGSGDIAGEGFKDSVSGINSWIFTSNADTIGVISFFNNNVAVDFALSVLSIQTYYDTPIPPDMSTVNAQGIPQQDIFGNDLVFKGQAEYKAEARDAGSFTGDGVAYFTITGLLTTDVITALSTDLPTCTTNGRLDIANSDKVFGVTITRASVEWAYIPFCEGSGDTAYDVSDNDHHAVGTDVDETNWGVINRPTEDYLAEYGGNFAGKFNGTDDYLDTGIAMNAATSAEIILKINRKAGEKSIIGANSGSTNRINFGWHSDNRIYGVIANGSSTYGYVATNTDEGVFTIKMVYDGAGATNADRLKIYINDVEQSLTFVGTIPANLGSLGGNDLYIGNTDFGYDTGQIYSASVFKDGTIQAAYVITGLAVTETDTSSNGNNGTWSGTGDHTAIIPALKTKVSDVLGQTLVYPQNGKNLIPQTYLSMPEDIRELIEADQQERFESWDESDFSVEDIFTQDINTTRDFGETHQGKNNVLKVTLTDTVSVPRIGTSTIYLDSADSYFLHMEYFIPLGQTAQDGIVYNGNASNTIGTLDTVGQWAVFEVEFTNNTSRILQVRLGVSDRAIGDVMYISRVHIFKKTTQTGNNLVSNGGARNAIGALVQPWVDASWIKGTGWSVSEANQKASCDGSQTATSLLYQAASVNNQTLYYVIKVSNYSAGELGIRHSGSTYVWGITSNGIHVIQADNGSYDNIVVAADADFVGDVDYVTCAFVIDSEFFEPEALGADPVVILTDYFKENPYRYLTRYFNAINWKDLIVVEADSPLDYNDHLKLLKFTQNN